MIFSVKDRKQFFPFFSGEFLKKLFVSLWSIPTDRHILIYYVGKSILVENRPLVKFIRNYIWDSNGVFSISSLVRILMSDIISCFYTVV